MGRQALIFERTERLETRAVVDGLAEGRLLDHRLVRRDARLPELVHEAILPGQLRRLRELLRLVPHREGGSGRIDNSSPAASRLCRSSSTLRSLLQSSGRRVRAQRVVGCDSDSSFKTVGFNGLLICCRIPYGQMVTKIHTRERFIFFSPPCHLVGFGCGFDRNEPRFRIMTGADARFTVDVPSGATALVVVGGWHGAKDKNVKK